MIRWTDKLRFSVDLLALWRWLRGIQPKETNMAGKKKTKKGQKKGTGYLTTILPAVAILLSVLATRSEAVEFKVGPYTDGTAAVTAYAHDFSRTGTSRAATGICGMTLARVSYQGKWIADVFTPCALGATTIQGEASPTGLIGAELVNVLGLRGGVYYNTADADHRLTWTLGINLLGLTNKVAQ